MRSADSVRSWLGRFVCAAGVLSAGALSVGTVATAQEPKLVAETEPLSAEEQLKKFHLPPGFKIELIAAEPECRKPMNLKFDAAGRLLFTQSIEYPWPVKEGETGRDTIRVMTDTNDDGVPDKTEVFAEGLNIPIGITPVHDAVLGYSIPTLYRFDDKDRNYKADDRKELYERFGFRDTHGMCSSLNWWVDGWVYGCHGFSNESTVQGKEGGPSITMQSGNTYRLRPDGSRIEYYTHGQVNPFGMTHDFLGNVYTSDCHTRPAYLIVRGAYYPSFGKPHDGLGFGPELMQHAHGSTGIAGVVSYDAQQFPAEYHRNLLIGNPVTGRVNRDRLEWNGSTAKAIEQPDFLTCDDPWFRPVDLQLAPDGSIYIADFYNRIIGHYEVPLTHPGRDRERGRIWRISYQDDAAASIPPVPRDMTKLGTADLIKALGHSHLPVVVQATHQLVHRIGEAGATAWRDAFKADQLSPQQKAFGLWVVERQGGLDPDTIAKLGSDADRLVRLHLVKALAERPTERWTTSDRLWIAARLKEDSDPFVRRAAAEALGRHPDEATAEQLLSAWKGADGGDALLVHTIRIALRDTLQTAGALNRIAAKLPQQIPTDDAARVAEIALAIPNAESAAYLLAALKYGAVPQHRWADAAHQTGRHLAQDQLPQWKKLWDGWRQQPAGQQVPLVRACWRAMQERGEPAGEGLTNWANDLTRALIKTDSEGDIRQGIDLARDFRLGAVGEAVAALGSRDAKFGNLRQPALEALAAADAERAVAPLMAVLTSDSEPRQLREQAAALLGGLNRDEAQKGLLAQLKVAPQALAVTIARGLVASPKGGALLLGEIEAGRAAPQLLQDQTVGQKLASLNLPNGKGRIDKILEGLPQEDQRIVELMKARRAGYEPAQKDLSRGQVVFQQNCANCHRLNNQGGKVGPELEGVGLRGLDRLLEDTLNPSRNVDQAFRASVVQLSDGRVLTGLVLREEGEVLVFVDEQGREQPIPLKEIDERATVKLSPMPANVAEKLTEQQFYDLMAYLLSQKAKPVAAP